jgi:hypothetical protein
VQVRYARWLAASVVVGTIVIVYREAFTAGLLNWDDNRFLTDNPLFRGSSWGYAWAALSQIQFEAYQPLHLLSYLPDRWLWPDDALGFHVVNLALFCASALIVWRLALRRASVLAATCATLLFALHPLAVEPVMWVTARKDLLALLFMLLALSLEDRDYRPRAVPVALGVAAMLTKSAMVSFPVVLIAWLVWMRQMPWRAALRGSLPYGLPAVAAAITVAVIWHAHGMIAPAGQLRVLDVPAAFGVYAARIVVPIDLSPMYDEHAPALAALGFGIAVAALAIARRRVPAPAWFVGCAFVAVLAPVSNVVPILRFADRYTLPVLALAVPALALLLDVAKLRRGLVGLAVLAAAAAGWASSRQAEVWHDSIALWTQATRAQPDSLLAHIKLGETLRDSNEYGPAIDEYRTAIRLAPDKQLGLLGLFYVHATRAEHDHALAQGTAARWLAQLRDALVDPHEFGRMFGEIAASGCMPCKDTLLVLGLHTWIQDDDALLADAADALDRGVPDEALVFLGEVRVHDARYAALFTRAAQPR